jgi:leader peptidase (prepilin peptidase)/N-methyltransferase
MGDLLVQLGADARLFVIVSVVLGLVVGSFLNVVIHRLPRMLQRDWEAQCRELLATPEGVEVSPDAARARFDLISPPSRCPSCGHRLRPWENIPVISYLVLRGRCGACRSPISLQYPAVELLTGALTGLLAWHLGPTPVLLAAWGFTWALIALSVIDLHHQILPDAITFPLLWVGLLLGLESVFVGVHSSLWGATLGYLSLWTVYQLFRLFTGKEGMGFGDFKLLAALGAWAGWQALPTIVLLSSAVGAVLGGLLMAFGGHARGQPLPFGPFLAVAGWITLFWGDAITGAYYRWMGL